MSARGRGAPGTRRSGLLAGVAVTGLIAAVLVPGVARADSGPLDPTNPATPTTATADALPTVQVDGVVWSQVVVGNTVYAAGRFSNARPAGAAPGTQLTPRANLLAYDIRTGQLITSFAPVLNAQALVVAASPDGSRIYVGGDFTKADGQTRNDVAAYSTATGVLDPTFRPSVTGRVAAIAATGSTVYLGGSFTAVGGTSRTHLAAVSASSGALLPWAPVPGVGSTAGNRLPNNDPANYKTSSDVLALVVTGGGAQVVAAGRFDSLNGVKSTGVGALDPSTGATRAFAINKLITNQGVNSAVFSLSTDGTTVYGTGYDYYGPGNLEGAFAANANGGAVRWIGDCRGDTYSSYPVNGALYLTSHTHSCENIQGYPQAYPATYRYATAMSGAATGRNAAIDELRGNTNFAGQPAPSLLDWFPTLTPGTFTGQDQAGWSVSGNGQYVVYGGEFPKVNGTGQQGLVRFALPGVSADKVGPTPPAAPTVVSTSPGTAHVSWRESTDADNENLTYRVYRDGGTTPVGEVTAPSRWYDVGYLGFTDTGLTAGGTHSYRIGVVDPAGNKNTGGSTSVTVAAGTTPDRAYAGMVRADGARDLWSFGEAGGAIGHDVVGGQDLALGSGVRLAQGGAIAKDADTSAAFNGTSTGFGATQATVYGPNTFSLEAWFQTTSSAGGRILGFGDKNTGLSTNYDRHVYMDAAGHVLFGVNQAALRTLSTTATYNDGRWHHVVASMSQAGMRLYVDGALVGSDPNTWTGQPFYGYWRVGGDSSWAGAQFFTGRIDEAAVYPVALTAAQVSNHYAVGARGAAVDAAPTASWTAGVSDLTASFDGTGSSDPDGTVSLWSWNFGDGATGTGRTVQHTYAAAGTYPVTLTVTDNGGVSASRTSTVTVSAPPPNVPPTAAFTVSGTGMAASFDASTSKDPDGTVTGYAWTFGDGTSATGVTAAHTYATAGSYQVTLAVTDDDHATTTTTRTVTAPFALASDAFERTVSSGLGTADLGGSWSVSGGTSSVGSGAAQVVVSSAGGSSSALLNAVAVRDVAVQATVSLDAMPTGGGTYVYLTGRKTSGGYYRAVVKFLSSGAVSVGVSRVVSGTETGLGSATVPGLTYTAGTALHVRLDVSGTGTATVAAKAWVAGQPEPAGWAVSATDTTAALDAPGAIGFATFVSGSATALPVRLRVADFWAGVSGTAPAV